MASKSKVMSALIPREQRQTFLLSVDTIKNLGTQIPHRKTTRAPRGSEVGLIMTVPHSLTCNPVFGRAVKYRCVQRAGSTRQWCDRFCSTVAKRGQYEWPTRGCWRSLAMIASVAFYTRSPEIMYQRKNLGATLVSLVCRRSPTKGGSASLATLRDDLRVS